MTEQVYVQGINELVRSFRRLDRNLGKQITDRLRVLARQVQTSARAVAAAEGFTPPGRSGRGTGLLIRDIKYSVRAGTAYIRETATRDGYRYPAVYEYGHSKWGHRPFLAPALEIEHQNIVNTMERLLDGLLRGF